jgi:hypothetical protein
LGVFSALCKDNYVVPVHSRLYLPVEWINDPDRCLEAKVPEDQIVLKTKDHLALVQMAMLFMLKERMENKEEYPLLSCGDIEKLLAKFLPRRDITTNEIIRQVKKSHDKRNATMESAARVQLKRKRLKPPG